MIHAVVTGTGSYVPDKIVNNKEYEAFLDTTDEWIQSRTGIRERRISMNEPTSVLGAKAAKRALEMADLKPEQIDLVLCATITPDSFMPSTACIIQKELGLKNAVAFDITAACSGLIFGMITASQYIQSGSVKHALVIGAETLSKALDFTDRGTCVLFGDGASAVILSSGTSGGILSFDMKSDGSKGEVLTFPAYPLRHHFNKEQEYTTEDRNKISMDGQEVFKFAVRSLKEHMTEVIEKANLSIEDIRYIIPHQANIRIIEHAAKLCHISKDRFVVNLEHYGNTSAASIGIALDELVREQDLQDGDKLILVGFGGGLTSGAILLEWGSHRN